MFESIIDYFKKADLLEYVTQFIGVLGMLAAIIAFQCKQHKKLMIYRTANEMLFAVQYAMLGAYTGVAMNVFGSIRNTVFTVMVAKKKNTTAMRFFFSAVFAIFIAITWDGFKSILSGFAKIVSTFAYGSSNPYFVRISILTTSLCWCIYNLYVKSFAGFISEILTISSIIISLIRFKKEDNSKENDIQKENTEGAVDNN